MYKQSKKIFFLFLISCISACKNQPEQTINPKIDNFNNGFFVLNEGTYGFGNATVSFFDKNTNQIKNDIFKQQNDGNYLGDQAQDMVFYDNKIYIVVQNSQTIVVVDAFSFKLLATIKSDLMKSPRYLKAISKSVAYVSDWESDGVCKINLITNKVEKIIKTGKDPEQMQVVDNKLFVCNSGYSFVGNEDQTISVIDLISETVSKNINIGIQPMEMVLDKSENIIIACRGKKVYTNQGEIDVQLSQESSLWKLNALTFDAIQLQTFSEKEFWIDNLTFSNDKNWLYYSFGGSVFAKNITQNIDTKLFTKSVYTMQIDSENGNFILGINQGFTSAGKIIRYEISGNKIIKSLDSATVGILPNAIIMK